MTSKSTCGIAESMFIRPFVVDSLTVMLANLQRSEYICTVKQLLVVDTISTMF